MQLTAYGGKGCCIGVGYGCADIGGITGGGIMPYPSIPPGMPPGIIPGIPDIAAIGFMPIGIPPIRPIGPDIPPMPVLYVCMYVCMCAPTESKYVCVAYVP